MKYLIQRGCRCRIGASQSHNRLRIRRLDSVNTSLQRRLMIKKEKKKLPDAMITMTLEASPIRGQVASAMSELFKESKRAKAGNRHRQQSSVPRSVFAPTERRRSRPVSSKKPHLSRHFGRPTSIDGAFEIGDPIFSLCFQRFPNSWVVASAMILFRPVDGRNVG